MANLISFLCLAFILNTVSNSRGSSLDELEAILERNTKGNTETDPCEAPDGVETEMTETSDGDSKKLEWCGDINGAKATLDIKVDDDGSMGIKMTTTDELCHKVLKLKMDLDNCCCNGDGCDDGIEVKFDAEMVPPEHDSKAPFLREASLYI